MAADVGWGRRVLALLVTFFGILIAGTLIGLIATGIEQRVEAMQRGRSSVVESGHIVILGASPRLPVVVEQVAFANRKGRPITTVVLANREPAELQAEVRAAVPESHGGRLVFRRGDPTRVTDLAIAGIRDARAIIVLADDDGAGDAGVVKAVLATGAALEASTGFP
jgi:voltage-gated potassium channel Kch